MQKISFAKSLEKIGEVKKKHKRKMWANSVMSIWRIKNLGGSQRLQITAKSGEIFGRNKVNLFVRFMPHQKLKAQIYITLSPSTSIRVPIKNLVLRIKRHELKLTPWTSKAESEFKFWFSQFYSYILTTTHCMCGGDEDDNDMSEEKV